VEKLKGGGTKKQSLEEEKNAKRAIPRHDFQKVKIK